MKIDFQQGILTYPSSTGQQVFLHKTGSHVSLQTSNGRVDFTVAHGPENYLFTEASDVDNAWGPLAPSTDYWLYWDINLLTAVRTFGFTTIEPLYGSVQPIPTPGQHWFDTVNHKMYVYNAGGWREVIRLFAAKVRDSNFYGLGTGIPDQPFAGSQVELVIAGLSAGRILVDDTGTPIRRATGQFFTTDTQFFVNGSPANSIKLEANIVNATARENIAKFQVVKYTSFGHIHLATYNDIQTTVLAMSMEDILFEHTGTLCVQGVITNPAWNFQHVGAPLWVTGYGLLTEVDPNVSNPLSHPNSKVPVARVLTSSSIFFDQGLGGKGDKGDNGTAVSLASESTIGIAKLSIAPVQAGNPIAVGDNDPRLTAYVHPATHPASIITTDTYGMLTGLTAQSQLHQLADRNLDSLSNVSVATPTLNDYLKWNGTNWISSPASVAQYLDDLLDVTLTMPASNLANGDVLVYNSNTQQWTSSTNHLIDLNGQTLKGPNIINYAEPTISTSIAAGVLNIDFALGGVAYCELTENVTSFNITNTDANNPWLAARAYSITLILQQDNVGNRTVSWTGETFKWDTVSGMPTVSTAVHATDVFTLITVDAGVTWLAFTSGQDLTIAAPGITMPNGTVTSISGSGGTTGLTVTGGPITNTGTLTLGGTLAIANGGTGQTSANAALNALLPSQVGNGGNFLATNGTDTVWSLIPTNEFTSSIWGWGANNLYQLGDGTNFYKSSPVQIGNLTTWRQVESYSLRTHAITRNNELWSWGYNNYGTLGLGHNSNSAVPYRVGTLKDWKQVSAGGRFTAAVKTDGTLWTWGMNDYGQLGDGTIVPKSSPIQVGSLTNWATVTCGYDSVAAIKTDGTLWTWGYNWSGQLGLGTGGIGTDRSSPVQVGTLNTWKALSCTFNSVIAVKIDGTLWSWGENGSGELGLGDTVDRSSPIQVGSLTDWKKISSGYDQTVAIKTDGTLWSWGYNSGGELGLGDVVHRSSPTQVGSLTDWNIINGGYDHFAAIKTDGTLWTWGRNNSGQLGDGTSSNKSSPVQVGLAFNWKRVSAGHYGTYAIVVDSQILPIEGGGTGKDTAEEAFEALAPVQFGNSGKVLSTINNNIQWSSLPYDITFYFASVTQVAYTLLTGFVSPRILTISEGSLNVAKCAIASATTATVFALKLNGVQFATVTFNVGSFTGTIAFTGGVGTVISVAAGDLISISVGATKDDTIAGIGITFVGLSTI